MNISVIVSKFNLSWLAVLLLPFISQVPANSEENWTPTLSYQDIIAKAQSGSPYFQGLLGIYLRAGEAGSAVNLDLSRQWSRVSHQKNHPFGLYNLANLSMHQGDFELATLRVLGASTLSLGIMLLFESLLIGIIGGLIGVLFAYGGAVGLAASFSTWQFHVTILIVPSVAYQLMLGVILIAVAMTPIGIWRLRRMDLVEKVKNLTQ